MIPPDVTLAADIISTTRRRPSPSPVSLFVRRSGYSALYVARIMAILKRNEFIKAIRGPAGGYIAHPKAPDINLFDLYKLMGHYEFADGLHQDLFKRMKEIII